MNTERPGGRPNNLTWHPIFVSAFAEYGTIKAACKVAGIDRHTFDEHRVKFPEFALALETISQEFVEEAELELYRRAVEGVETCIGRDSKGQPIIIIKKSDRLLEFFVKCRNRKVYGDQSKVEVAAALRTMTPEEEIAQYDKAMKNITATIRAAAMSGMPNPTGIPR